MALSVLSIVAAACLVAGFMTTKSWLKGDIHSGHHHDYKAAGSEAMESSHMPSLPKMYHHPHFNPFLVPYFTPMKYPGHPPPLVPVHHKHHHHPIPPFPHPSSIMKRHDNFQSRTFDTLDGWVGGGLDRTSDFYYILPILLVIGLGSFLIPIISTFFTAMVTSGGVGGCCGRRKRRHEGKPKPLLLEKINEIWEMFEESWDNFNLSNFTNTVQTELHNQGSGMKLEYS